MKRSIPDHRFIFSVALLVFFCTAVGACTPSIEKVWEFPIGSPIYSTPLVVNDFIIFGSESGTLHAVDVKGNARWTFQASSSEIFSRPITNGKLVFFGATNQMFYALDLRGQVKWQFAARERIKSDALVADNVVYLSSYDGRLYALQAETGKKIWQFPAEPKAMPVAVDAEQESKKAKPAKKEAKAAPVVAIEAPKPQAFSYAAPVLHNGVIYIGNLDGYMYAIHAKDGSFKWRFKTDGGITSTVLIQDGVLYFGSKDDHVYALDAATGKKLLWKFKTGDDVLSSARFGDGVIYIGSNDHNFYALDAKSGQEKCRFAAKGPVISAGTLYQNLIFFGGGQGDGNLYAIQKDSCQLFFSYKTGYKIESDPVLSGNQFYLTSGSRKLFSFRINKTQ